MTSPGCPILFKNQKGNLKKRKNEKERERDVRKTKKLGDIDNPVIRHQVFQVTHRADLKGETLLLYMYLFICNF